MDLTDQLPHELFQFRVYPDGHSGFPFASKHLLDFYQVTQEQIAHDASAVFGLQHPEDSALIAQSMEQAIRSQTPWQQEYRLLLPGNVTVWRSGSAQPQKMADGSVLWHGLVTDITERKRTEDELRVAATAFQSTQAMVITDANGRMQRANPAFLAMFGYHESEIQGRNPSMMSSGRHDKLFYQDLWQHLHLHRTWTGEIWNRRKSGEVFPDWLHISAVTDTLGAISHYVATHTDLTARKRLEDEVRQMAYFDPLTQLPNRRLLQDRLEQASLASSRTGSHGAVAFLDLDHFKQLNDTRGHETGDALLLQVAQRLRQCVREGDTVARLGGDEFILILVNLSTSEPQATAQARAIGEKIVRRIAEPFDLLGTPYACTCSVGFTLFHDRSHPMKALIQTADRAMYNAKARGRNGLAFVPLGVVPPNAPTEPAR
jgi:diguanylate cyclase (GGDEF)-like protein/PAS domain S-box-containing protein